MHVVVCEADCSSCIVNVTASEAHDTKLTLSADP